MQELEKVRAELDSANKAIKTMMDLNESLKKDRMEREERYA